MVETHLLFATLVLPYAILLFMACAGRIRAWSSFYRAFATERRGCILDQAQVVTEFHSKTPGRLNTRICEHPDEDNFINAVLFELEVEIRIGKAA